MTAAYLDTQPELLNKWSRMNPLGRLGRPDEMRGVIIWLASDASSFCTGSECVNLLLVAARMLIGWQHYREWWSSRVVRKDVYVGCHVYYDVVPIDRIIGNMTLGFNGNSRSYRSAKYA